MKSVLVRRAGGPDVLELVDLPIPEPGPGEVRVSVRAIGVNYADVMGRKAIHRSIRPPPIVIGCEASGVIDACGAGVDPARLQERVGVYSPFGGAYAEALTVPQQYALPLPANMPFEDAAAFTHVFLTAHEALHGVTPLSNGSTVLVTAAAGGLGGALIQLAQAADTQVIAAVGSEAKRRLLAARGVASVINYAENNLTAAVLAATNGRGVDLAVETVGGELFQQAQSALAPLGRIVIAGMAGGKDALPDVATLLDRSASCTTLNLSVIFAHRPDHIRSVWSSLIRLYAAGKLQPRIGQRFKLQDAAAAHRLLESRASTDKILLLS
jgi:NADPH2:quinone reductase